MDYRTVIDYWGSPSELAEEIGVKPDRVRKWYARNRIPAEFWADILAAARLRRIPLTADQMVIAATPKANAA